MEGYNRFAFYFGMVMSLLYVAGGIFVFFNGDTMFSLYGTQKLILSVLLAGYGCYRFTRYLKNKQEQNNLPANEK